MGYFTWKFADKHNKSKLIYGTKGYVACPDGSFIEEKYYDGYGIFGGQDIYELVVDWNKENLVNIFKHELKSAWNYLLPVAQAYVEGKSEDEIIAIWQTLDTSPYAIAEDWKRNLGIAIACYEEDNAKLPYPIKIVSTTNCNYYDLPRSISCQ